MINNSGLKIGLASGPALVVNMNNILDLFGTTIKKAARIVSLSDLQNIAICQNTIDLPEVQQYLAGVYHKQTTVNKQLKGIPGLSGIVLLTV